MASRFLTEADKNELAKRIPTKTSELSNDSGYVTDDAIPTKTSQLTNDSKYQNESQVKASITEALKDVDINVDVDLDDYALKEDIPTKTSQLTNDSKYQNEAQVKASITEALKDIDVDVDLDGYALKEEIPTKTSQLMNDSGFLTKHQDLSGYALKESIPTKTSQLENDSGFLTEHQDLSSYASKEELEQLSEEIVGLKGNAVTFRKETLIGKNLFNPAECVSGQIESAYSAGDVQSIKPNTNMVTQKIVIEKGFDYALNGVRIYVITDENDIRVTPKDGEQPVWIPEGQTSVLRSDNLNEGSYYLWVSAYTKYMYTLTQVEKGDVCTNYEPYMESIEEGFYLGETEKITDFPNELAEENKKKIDALGINTNRKLVGAVSTSTKVNVSDNNGQKLILRLHKRPDVGYGAKNDIYLPYAKEDFSDVRIKTNSGEDIKYTMHSRINGIDILQDYRLGINARGKVYQNSDGDLIHAIDGKMCISKNNGKNWEEITGITITWPITTLITSDDTLYFSKEGVLYRSEKPYTSFEEVLDSRESYSGVYILSGHMVELENGTLLCSAYQSQRAVRIYKSTDNGVSWTYCLNDTSGKYQHIHKMNLDTTVEPNVIYVGCDGGGTGGGILKSDDNGITWVDLSDSNSSIPEATDHGMLYVDASGYKLFGGETSVVGGYTIIKEINGEYRGVLGIGNGCYYIAKFNGLLIAPVICSTNYRNTAILVSNDEGENWTTVFTSSPLNHDSGASDGFRFLSEIKNNNDETELIIGSQSSTQPSVRIAKGCYAEIIVDVPENTETLIIESGYNGSDYENVVNDALDDLPVIINYDFSSKEESFNYIKGGKHLSFIYPPIIKEDDNYAMSMKYLTSNPLNIAMDISQKSSITISFWGYDMDGKNQFSLIEELDSGNNYGIMYGGWIYKMPVKTAICKVRNDCKDVWDKFDFVIDFNNNTIKTYLNGKYVSSNGSVDVSEQLTALKNAKNFKMFRHIYGEHISAIQHLAIFDGAKTDEQIYDGFNAGLTDLIN